MSLLGDFIEKDNAELTNPNSGSQTQMLLYPPSLRVWRALHFCLFLAELALQRHEMLLDAQHASGRTGFDLLCRGNA